MSFGPERMEQLLGHVRGKATEPCATAHDAVAVPPGRSFDSNFTGAAFP
jgi:hypothetical protein